MAITLEEVFETVSMTLFQNLDIRSVTLGINLKDCIRTDFEDFRKRVYIKIHGHAQHLIKEAAKLEHKYGIPITNKRIAVTPVSLIMESFPETSYFVAMAETLDQAARDAGIDFIGGYGALVQKGMTRSEEVLLKSLPEVLAKTERVCAFMNVGSYASGMNLDAVIKIGRMIHETAHRTEHGIGCARFVVFVNAPEDNPFMAGAFHGVGEPDCSLNIGISGPGVVAGVVEKNPELDLSALADAIKKTVFKITRTGELIGRELAKNMAVPFGIVDISLASTTKEGDSVARILEHMGVDKVGAPGTTLALAVLMDAVKKGGAMASANVGGLSGTFIPVSEDLGMIESVKAGALTLEKLEALTAVCSVGMDMFAIPGSTPPEVISALIADELSIGIINNKATAVRVIPVPFKAPGDSVTFGGLLGEAPVMPVSRFTSNRLMRRGGRMPAPITSLRN
jgi:uncharacterized protein (UPF0210 family)